jgi:hypothetical protein
VLYEPLRSFNTPQLSAPVNRRCSNTLFAGALAMKIATFNVNNINRRLPNLLQWLKSARPDIACLQELKSTDANFPIHA